jgi:quinol monooxygenase YgiN
MIIVLGSAIAQPGHFDEALALSEAHVARSRKEPGCMAHAVHVDTENPLRLVFVEQWADMAALQAHFKVPESRAFGKALASLSSQPPDIALYDASALPLKS